MMKSVELIKLLSATLLVVEKLTFTGAGTTKSPQTTIVTVQQQKGGYMKILPGYHEPGIIWANLTNTQTSTGWLYLDISSNSSWPNHHQALAAGMAEGFLTGDLIHEYYKEYIHKPFCNPYPDFCTWVKAKFEKNKAWVEDKVKNAGDDPYWSTVGLFYDQLEGVRQGWERYSGGNYGDMDIEHGIMFVNFYADISDFITKYQQEKEESSLTTRSFSSPSCSVLIKLLPDSSDIYVGHDTWHEYSAMSFRIIKRYSLGYRLPGTEGDLVPGHTISMSSYAGCIFSLDDFYSLSSGLASIETTLFVYDSSLYELVVPDQALYEPVRAMVANRLAVNGRSWSNIFRQHNSGTYNNQWMVVDYNKVGGLEDVLWVVEQLPGQVVAEDQTRHLLEKGYWASYNRAFYKDVFRKSGAQGMVDQFGDWFSYQNNPRAAIFSRDHSSVTDINLMARLMRSNSFSTDPVSQVSGCNGAIPAAAVANRGDLHPSDVTCTFGHIDKMVGFRPYGAIDMKIQSSSSANSQSFLAVAGPTTSGHLPFSWSSSGFDKSLVPSYRPIDTWDFSPEWIVWPRALGSKQRGRSITTEEMTYPSAEETTTTDRSHRDGLGKSRSLPSSHNAASKLNRENMGAGTIYYKLLYYLLFLYYL